MIRDIVRAWRRQNPPGRFIARTDPSNKEGSLWEDVGDEMAWRKAAKVLSEGLAGGKRRSSAVATGDKGYQGGKRKRTGDVSSLDADLGIAPRSDHSEWHTHVQDRHEPEGLYSAAASYASTPFNSRARELRQDNPSSEYDREVRSHQDSSNGLRFDDAALESLPVAASLTTVFDDSDSSNDDEA